MHDLFRVFVLTVYRMLKEESTQIHRQTLQLVGQSPAGFRTGNMSLQVRTSTHGL